MVPRPPVGPVGSASGAGEWGWGSSAPSPGAVLSWPGRQAALRHQLSSPGPCDPRETGSEGAGSARSGSSPAPGTQSPRGTAGGAQGPGFTPQSGTGGTRVSPCLLGHPQIALTGDLGWTPALWPSGECPSGWAASLLPSLPPSPRGDRLSLEPACAKTLCSDPSAASPRGRLAEDLNPGPVPVGAAASARLAGVSPGWGGGAAPHSPGGRGEREPEAALGRGWLPLGSARGGSAPEHRPQRCPSRCAPWEGGG